MSIQSRKIGFWPVFALVVGSQIGSGVFLLPASLAALGSVGLLGWVITGIGAIFLALVFSHLCAHIPKTGGPHAYVMEAFGREAGFYTAWTYWLVSWVSSTALVITAVGELSPLMGGLLPFQQLILEITILFLILALNLKGVKVAGQGEIILSALKLLPLVLIPLYGIFYLDITHLIPLTCTNGSLSQTLSSAALLTFWGFIGLETGTTPAENVMHPQKTIPKALVLGTVFVAGVYIFNTFAIMGLIPSQVLCHTASPYAVAAQILWGPAWDSLVSLMIAIVCVGTLNAWVLTSGQIAKGAAKDGLFPTFFLKQNGQGAPLWGVLLSGLGMVPFFVLLMNKAFVHQINAIIDLSVTAFLFVYGLCVLSFLRLIWQKKIKPSFGLWALGAFALAFCLWPLWAVGLETLGLAALIPLSGLILKKVQRARLLTKFS